MFTHRNTRPLIAIVTPLDSLAPPLWLHLKWNGQINRNASVRPFLTKGVECAMYSTVRIDPIYGQSAPDSLVIMVPASATDRLVIIDPAIERSATECLVVGIELKRFTDHHPRALPQTYYITTCSQACNRDIMVMVTSSSIICTRIISNG